MIAPTALHPLAGAGFYTAKWGPLPFVLGCSVAEEYMTLEVVRP